MGVDGVLPELLPLELPPLFEVEGAGEPDLFSPAHPESTTSKAVTINPRIGQTRARVDTTPVPFTTVGSSSSLEGC